MCSVCILNLFYHFQVYKALLGKTKSIPGAKVENNKFCLSVHYRCVEEKVFLFFFLNKLFLKLISIIFLYCIYYFIKKITYMFFLLIQNWNELNEQVKSVLKGYPKLRLCRGRKVPIDGINWPELLYNFRFNVIHFLTIIKI